MTTIDEELTELEKKIRQLKIEFDIFFVGSKKSPPTNLRYTVETYIQRLLEDKRFTFAQKFKFNTLVARYNVYRELWRKKTQEKEEKGILRDAEDLQRLIEHNMTTAAAAGEERNKYSFVTDNPAQQIQEAQAFFDFMQEAHASVGTPAPAMDFPKFVRFLQIKTTEIQQKYSCQAVEFQVEVDRAEQKVRFKANVKKTSAG